MRRAAPICCLLLACLLAPPAGLAAPAEIERALSDARYQRALPPAGLADGGGRQGLDGGAGSGRSAGGGDRESRVEPSPPRREQRTDPQPPRPEPREPSPERRDTGPPPDMERIGGLVMAAALAAVGLVLLFILVRWIRRGGHRDLLAAIRRFFRNFLASSGARKKTSPDDKAAKPAARPTPASRTAGPAGPAVPDAGRPLTEWERLARAGDFAGAVHAILRYALSLSRSRFGIETGAELTSREILRAMRRHRDAVQPMATIVAAVEFIHFGGRSATMADYERCAASLAQLDRKARPS
jgi:hypothetical protein